MKETGHRSKNNGYCCGAGVGGSDSNWWERHGRASWETKNVLDLDLGGYTGSHIYKTPLSGLLLCTSHSLLCVTLQSKAINKYVNKTLPGKPFSHYLDIHVERPLVYSDSYRFCMGLDDTALRCPWVFSSCMFCILLSLLGHLGGYIHRKKCTVGGMGRGDRKKR
jgi:hypothetical protein